MYMHKLRSLTPSFTPFNIPAFFYIQILVVLFQARVTTSPHGLDHTRGACMHTYMHTQCTYIHTYIITYIDPISIHVLRNAPAMWHVYTCIYHGYKLNVCMLCQMCFVRWC